MTHESRPALEATRFTPPLAGLLAVAALVLVTSVRPSVRHAVVQHLVAPLALSLNADGEEALREALLKEGLSDMLSAGQYQLARGDIIFADDPLRVDGTGRIIYTPDRPHLVPPPAPWHSRRLGAHDVAELGFGVVLVSKRFLGEHARVDLDLVGLRADEDEVVDIAEWHVRIWAHGDLADLRATAMSRLLRARLSFPFAVEREGDALHLYAVHAPVMTRIDRRLAEELGPGPSPSELAAEWPADLVEAFEDLRSPLLYEPASGSCRIGAEEPRIVPLVRRMLVGGRFDGLRLALRTSNPELRAAAAAALGSRPEVLTEGDRRAIAKVRALPVPLLTCTGCTESGPGTSHEVIRDLQTAFAH